MIPVDPSLLKYSDVGYQKKRECFVKKTTSLGMTVIRYRTKVGQPGITVSWYYRPEQV